MKSLSIASTFPIESNHFVKKDTLENIGITSVVAAHPMKVRTYAELVDMVAKLAYFNRRYVLFFRGQPQEYRIGNQFPTIYPTYFRKYIQKTLDIDELKTKLEIEQNILKIKNHIRKPRFHGAASIFESLHLRWSLLQHYGICDTPVIDITQSLYVAASFALLKSKKKDGTDTGIIYVLAFPWPSKNYHNNKEEELYLVRLAGITPPQAKRPYRQEAYAVMSQDVDTKQINNLERYDFAQRMVCKFEINNSSEFWGNDMKVLPNSFLVPPNDTFYTFMREKLKLKDSPNVR
jgi:hypothetical protein